MEQGDSILTLSLSIIIQALLPLAMGYLVVFINAKIKEAYASKYGQHLAIATDLAQQLVAAAEQNGLRGALEQEGKVKKDYVMAVLQTELDARGIKLNIATIDALVESAVFAAFSELQWLQADEPDDSAG